MNTDFPRVLSLLRKERQFSQKKVAADLNIAQALLSHYEKGKRECGLEFLVRAADYYNVSTDYLLGRSAVSTGTVIVESEISDSEDIKKNNQKLGSLSAALAKTLIINSIETIYSLLSKSKNPRLITAITNVITFSIYKVIRLIHKSNSINDKQFFGISEEMAFCSADAGSAIYEGVSLKILSENADLIPPITTLSLETEYKKQAAAMLNLIKNCENYLKEFEPK